MRNEKKTLSWGFLSSIHLVLAKQQKRLKTLILAGARHVAFLGRALNSVSKTLV